MEKISLSIVIPVYNEEHRLEPRVYTALEYFKNTVALPYEIIFVNDGSLDQTHTLLKKLTKTTERVRVLSYSVNMGKGYAIKTGVLDAQGEKVITMDADFSVDLNEVPRFIAMLDTYEVVIGTKKHLLTQTLNSQKAPRRILGKGYTFLVNALFDLDFTDITCGFKAFRNSVAKHLFAKQKINRWSYDTETLFLAKKFGYTTTELPVKWHHIEGSKVSPFKDTLRSLKDLSYIMANHYYGKYD